MVGCHEKARGRNHVNLLILFALAFAMGCAAKKPVKVVHVIIANCKVTETVDDRKSCECKFPTVTLDAKTGMQRIVCQ